MHAQQNPLQSASPILDSAYAAKLAAIKQAAWLPASCTLKGNQMSHAAQDLIELLRLAQGGAGALTQHLLREVAKSLIAAGIC